MDKERLLQLLSDFSEQYGETYEKRCIYDNDFDAVADAILKLQQGSDEKPIY